VRGNYSYKGDTLMHLDMSWQTMRGPETVAQMKSLWLPQLD